MRALSYREKWITGAAVMVIAMLMGDRIIFQTWASLVSGLGAEAAALEGKIHLARTLEAERPRIEEEIRTIETLGALSGGTDQAELLAEVDAVSRETGLGSINLRPDQAGSVGISAEGSWVSVVKFCQSLQAAPHLFDVHEVRISKRSAADSMLHLDAVVEKAFLSP